MKLTINITDEKAAFFLELLQNFNDFVSIEKAEEVAYPQLSDEHLSILNERLIQYENAPHDVLDWKNVQQEIKQKLAQ